MKADVSIALGGGRPRPRFVLVSDLDHTMVQNEDASHARLLAFNRLWAASFAADSLLVFSTGRSPSLFAELWDEAPLLTPDILICSVGTELFYRVPGTTTLVPDSSWEAELDNGWDRGAVAAVAARHPRLKPQPASEQRRHKVSFHLERGAGSDEDVALLGALRSDLAAAGVAAKVVYSGGVDVDVLAQGAGKGRALEFLLAQLRRLGAWPAGGVQVNGDSGNDAELFTVPRVRGCVVANAHKELLDFYHAHTAAAEDGKTDGKAGGAAAGGEMEGGDGEGAAGARIFLASQPCAGGIVEALEAFGSVAAAAAAAAGGGGGGPAAAAARRGAAALAALQGGGGGGLAAAAEPGATRVGGAGWLAEIGAEAAAAGGGGDGEGVVWADQVAAREAAPGLALATYQLWSFSNGRRDSRAARACSALLRVGGGAGAAAAAAVGAPRVVHVHEAAIDYDLTMTKALRDLATGSEAYA
ncbi:MAG: sucrose-6F-phosphate phosphohydrolase-domain-containing protein [Monoraphidium minutum]|nr:MAG: sucrose-6F-phosphate phosphohydrolase-domain-containing protein [Monoraphidium minutum]